MDAQQALGGPVVMKFHSGDTVIVYETRIISVMLNEVGEYGNLYFNPEMRVYCGKEMILDTQKRDGVWSANNDWYWHEHWFTHETKDFFSIDDFEI